MIEKKTMLNRGEIDFETGIIGVRFAKLIIENGSELLREWHRASIEPGDDVDATMIAINAHLVQMGKAKIEQSEINRLKAVMQIIQTPDVVQQFKDKQAKPKNKV